MGPTSPNREDFLLLGFLLERERDPAFLPILGKIVSISCQEKLSHFFFLIMKEKCVATNSETVDYTKN